MTSTLLTIITATAVIVFTEISKRAISQFFSIGKKISHAEYNRDMKEIKEGLHDNRIFMETGLKSNRTRSREYTNDVLKGSNEIKAVEFKAIKEIVSLSMDKLEVMIKGQTLYMSSIDKRLERIENIKK